MGQVKRNRKKETTQYGTKIAVIDRRREAWGLRAKGLSFRGIAEIQGTSLTTAYVDCKRAEEEFGQLNTDPEILREGILQLHQQISGMLIEDLTRQAEAGQVTTEIDDQGRRTTTTRRWLNPQLAAEASRNLQRMAGLMGLSDGPVDGGSQQTTTVVMVSPPADGASFEAKYASPAVDVTPQAPEPAQITAEDKD
jgi:hypothetical protein